MNHSTNYRSTLIIVAEDCPVDKASPPEKVGSVAHLHYELLRHAPYSLTSDELLLAVDKARSGSINEAVWAKKSRACLRASPLVKRYGFGLHHDAEARVALVPVCSDAYKQMLINPAIMKRQGMRNRRN
ncbi:hypothetical protein F1654_07180 [Alkalicaulis satelles]|uniref:Uncharacterized protein n=1 Tax=Alkalicaulis satelles TaxID=2609175 RepID=A0A5M6ZFS5_9PROT|nr:DUF6157 family protein [Alkalicaulis satelles]KAA5803579.1 hypothetical protein F1654_07180 [Alkalicaulis satelles]